MRIPRGELCRDVQIRERYHHRVARFKSRHKFCHLRVPRYTKRIHTTIPRLFRKNSQMPYSANARRGGSDSGINSPNIQPVRGKVSLRFSLSLAQQQQSIPEGFLQTHLSEGNGDSALQY